MSQLRLRPRFVTTTHIDPNEVLERLQAALQDSSGPVTGQVFTSSVVLRITPEAVHFWSPRLELSVDPHLGGGSVVHGLFGPRPSIWSFFMALYAATAFLGSMGVIYGWSDWSLGGTGHALWAGPAALVSAGVIYVAGRLGRRLGMDQMRLLKRFMEDALAD